MLRAGANRDDVLKRVRAAVDETIGGIARLDAVYVCVTLPKTRAGKTVRRLLREIAESGTATSDLTGVEDTEIVTNVMNEVAAQKRG